MKMLAGSCVCGTVKFHIPDTFAFMGNCHCNECRKFSGADYASVGGVPSDQFVFLQGEDSVKYYAKTEETDLAFCSNCGSSLFSRKKTAKLHNVRLGTLDDAPSNHPSFHIFTAEKAPWNSLADELPKFEAGPPKK